LFKIKAECLESRGEPDWRYFALKVLVVYDSVFGNTEQIARTIGNIPGSQEDVGILRVSHVKPEQLTGVEFLIVGYSTRRFKPTAAINTFLKRIPKK